MVFTAVGMAPDNIKEGKVLHPDLMNPAILKAEYAVRGELYNRAMELAAQGREIIYTNVGNPHQLGGKPLTFNREVISLMLSPWLLDLPQTQEMFRPEVIERAREMSGFFGGAAGAYTDSRGVAGIRKEVAAFISERDGHACDPESIFLTDGASVAVRYALHALIRTRQDAILCPIPQYPLYSAAIELFGGELLPYHLREESGWALDVSEIAQQIERARARGVAVRGLVLINPGNPTGQIAHEDNLRELIKLAHEEGLVLMADEVYQPNIYVDRPFVSCKKVLREMGEPYAHGVELASFHTVSKGVTGECGLRGGYVEWVNFHPDTIAQLYKIASINLCPNTVGQACVGLAVNPPSQGTKAGKEHATETRAIHESMQRRAAKVTAAFNALPGVTCNPTEGAMYAFPRLHLPPKAVEAARAAGKAPDTFYCLALLDYTGIVTVPGTGFGQVDGTWHMRTTILPQEDVLDDFCNRFAEFHQQFMDKYA
ncbi:aminotransferase [Helicosporidium sp. ATCC 50920]|nr:aminotransferase [Helicosporidium sp. ATCC 50920]|eukprot:KDD76740.1 aminotransferase [Helicosporidium sp. ATCC 50920]